MTIQQGQWIRKLGLVVFQDQSGLDLSDMHVEFRVSNADQETPNTAYIRVWNLSDATTKRIKGEFSQVTLSAGYEGDQYGVIFQGTIKRFAEGNENATDRYFDIYAADGDAQYNFAVANATLPAGSSPQDVINKAAKDMGLSAKIVPGSNPTLATGGVLPRGKVLFGMYRHILRNASGSIGSTWSIQNGQIQVLPLQGYLPNEAVVLTGRTGMIGFPQQTDQGIDIKCLLNPKILVGGRIQIDNATINKMVGQTNIVSGAPNIVQALGYGNPDLLAITTANDGIYRVFVAEHSGDTRGNSWFTDLVCLSVDQATGLVESKQ